jgi:hypothetical protein
MITEHIYQNIQGWFTFPNFYSSLVDQAKDGYHFVEVGAWKGKSSAYLAVEIANSNKQIQFDCVDTWEGDISISSSYSEPLLEIKDGLYNHFLQNIEPVKKYINPIRMTSKKASTTYQDGSLNCVFIDGDHNYDSILLDIKSWLPKIKQGGLLSGHDYAHPPIQQVLEELFPGKHAHISSEDVWIHKVAKVY